MERRAERFKKKLPRAVALVTSGILTLAACGGGGSTSEKVKPGGEWVTPQEGQQFSATLPIDVRAYPTRRYSDPDIQHVDVTASWEGRPGSWLVICTTNPKPSEQPLTQKGDHYRCDWDPKKAAESVPAGQVHMTFNVFDKKNNVNEAPHGQRNVTYAPTSS